MVIHSWRLLTAGYLNSTLSKLVEARMQEYYLLASSSILSAIKKSDNIILLQPDAATDSQEVQIKQDGWYQVDKFINLESLKAKKIIPSSKVWYFFIACIVSFSLAGCS